MKKLIALTLSAILLVGLLVVPVLAAYPSSPNQPSGLTLIAGEIIGNPEGWNNNPDTGAHAAFDGYDDTFYDAISTGHGYAGMKVSEPYVLREIRILPRGDQLPRFKNVQIFGMNADVSFDDFNGTQGTLIWESNEPAEDHEWVIITEAQFLVKGEAFTQYIFTNTRESGDNDHHDVQLVEFWGVTAASLAAPASVTPYKNIVISGGTSKINATDFDVNGFSQSNNDGIGQDIRPGEDIGTEFGDNDQGFEGNVGWTDRIEWMQWTVNVETAGRYSFDAWIASDSGNGGIDLFVGSTKVGSSPEGKPGNGWQDYAKYTIGEIDLAAGANVVKIEFWAGGGINIAGFDVIQLSAGGVGGGDANVSAAAPVVAVSVPVAVPQTGTNIALAFLAFAATAVITTKAIKRKR